MIIFKPTGQKFSTLKEAKVTLGTNRFRRLNKAGLIEFDFSDNDI